MIVEEGRKEGVGVFLLFLKEQWENNGAETNHMTRIIHMDHSHPLQQECYDITTHLSSHLMTTLGLVMNDKASTIPQPCSLTSPLWAYQLLCGQVSARVYSKYLSISIPIS